MPELPEVETIRRDLGLLVTGRTITAVRITPNAERILRGVSPAAFARRLRDRRIDGLSRRGKYLLFHLSGRGKSPPVYLVAHLRMTGSLVHCHPGDDCGPYLRAVLTLDDGSELRYNDLRKLGELRLVDRPKEAVGGLGPEPLERDFTARRLEQRLAGRKAPVKAAILDQRAVAGLGNIYADEALFAARINPKRPAGSLTEAEVRRLHRGIRSVLNEAVGNRGSSFRDYVDGAGREGAHHLHVKVFRRTGQPCYVCGTAVERARVGGRSTHFCPICQPATA